MKATGFFKMLISIIFLIIFDIMDSSKKILLGEKLKAAASSGNKAHVIARQGQWVIFKEGAKKATAQYATRESAIINAQKILKSGEVETLVVHKKDGSVYKVQSLDNLAI